MLFNMLKQIYYTLFIHTKTMVLPAGVLLTKLDWIKSAVSRIDVYEACSLLMAENMSTPIIIFLESWNLKIFTD